MSVLSLILALGLEQIRPVPWRQHVEALLAWLARSVAAWYDDGSAVTGRVAWLLVIGGAGLAVWLAHAVLLALHPLLAFCFDTVVLYVLIGFRWHEKQYADIHLALSMGRTDEARAHLEAWRGVGHAEASATEVARLAIEQALVTGHRVVFGPLVWFVLLPGPVGIVIYRLAVHLARAWGRAGEGGDFGAFARTAFGWIDWVPVRASAIAFSLIGHFERAMECWRTQAPLWHDRSVGILLAAGGGALGVRLGLPVRADGLMVERPAMGGEARADAGCMQKTNTLLWRVLVLYVLVLVLLAIALRAGS